MAENPRRRNSILALLVLLILIVLLLLRCRGDSTAVRAPDPGPTPSAPATSAKAPVPDSDREPDEVLTPATLTAPERVSAGAGFSVAWTGPDNRGDYVTIVRKEAPASASGNYKETKEGGSLTLTAPVEPGAHEVRYVTGRSHTILGRAPVEVVPVDATLDAAAEVVLGTQVSVAWTGPDNKGDYITIVPKETPDGQYGNYTTTDKGSPVSVTAPSAAGDAELRYMTGQGHKLLARRPIRILMPDVSLTAPADAIAGSTLEVTWTGPNNPGDYITAVTRETPDGQYANYTLTSGGSPVKVVMPISPGSVELRYMTGQGNRVLGRRPIEIVAVKATLSAPAEAAAGSEVTITWTGPNYPGDYVTVVAAGTPDGQYGNYATTSGGSPLKLKLPATAGDAELRYVTEQANTVLARLPIKIVP